MTNAFDVLETLCREPTASRAQLTARTGLSPASISRAVAELRDAGLVVERPLSRAGVGRPPRVVQLRSNAAHIVGIDAGGSRLRVVLADLEGNLVARATATVRSTARAGQLIGSMQSRRLPESRASWTPSAARCCSRPTFPGSTGSRWPRCFPTLSRCRWRSTTTTSLRPSGRPPSGQPRAARRWRSSRSVTGSAPACSSEVAPCAVLARPLVRSRTSVLGSSAIARRAGGSRAGIGTCVGCATRHG